jgi:hypothetical protein
MNKDSQSQNKHLPIGIFSACDAPLDELDLSSFNLKFVKLKELPEHVFSLAGNIPKDFVNISSVEWFKRWSPGKLIALVPINLDNDLRKLIFQDVLRVLLLLYRSEFRQLAYQQFVVSEEFSFLQTEQHWTDVPFDEKQMRFPLRIDRAELANLKAFMELYLQTEIPKYLTSCIDNYAAHFYQWKKSLAYLSLCICLETISEGKEQITYKIRRNFSIINGKSVEDCRKIFKNVGLVYSLRSKIAHGEEYDPKLIDTYLPYLRSLISSTIIELTVHRVATRGVLNDAINELGFGDKARLSKSYDSAFPDLFCRVNSIDI